MKKASYLAIGIALGIGLSTSGSAIAAVTKGLIGKTVKSEISVYVDNKLLAEKAPVVDGRSYLPVRKLAEISGMNLSQHNNAIYLKSPAKEVKNEESEPDGKIPTDRPLTPEEILTYQQELLYLNQTLSYTESLLMKDFQDLSTNTQTYNQYTLEFKLITLQAHQAQVETLKARKAELEKAIKLTP